MAQSPSAGAAAGSPAAYAGLEEFASKPAEFFSQSWYAMQHLPAGELAAFQLAALRMRFDQLREQIPVLKTMVDETGVTQLDSIDDVVPLLFQHSVYKSYPQALLVKNRFAELTRWLDRLTTHDLSSVDVSACDSIDSWLDVLDAQTPLRVAHTSGTSGTMSFLPRAQDEWDEMFAAVRCGLFQYSDPTGAGGRHEGEYFNLIWPLYRHGRSAIMRAPQMGLPHLLGSEDRLHALRPGSMSSDAMFLAGRLRAAAARGEVDQLEINPALRARKEQFEREQREMADTMPVFIEEIVAKLRGERVWVLATWNVLYMIARAALDKGMSHLFAPDSLVSTGGGAKGATVPDDWEDTVREFTGVEHIQHMYVMSEITAMNKMCERGRYHFEPWIIPFVLDPGDGRPLPREGVQTGRAAVFDVLPASYWGGFISGDEVTASFDPCECGRTTIHLARKIERFSEKQGGDDKITCLASEDAHRAALEFLTTRLA
jgi:hypothetical protein